jgi:hypothetical protein
VDNTPEDRRNVEKVMGKLMYCENDKWIIRNYAARRMVDRFGQSRRVTVPGEMIVLDRSSKPNGELPDLEVLESTEWVRKRGLGFLGLFESQVAKAALVAFALGAWLTWSVIVTLVVTT